MPLTPEDVQNKRFTTTRFRPGYDEDEVDAFLDEVEAELTRLLQENAALRTRQGTAPAPAPTPVAAPTPPAPEPPAPAEPEGGQDAALRTLLLAQRTADEAIAQARRDADQLLAEARSKAGSMEQEAREQHAAAMADLDRKRRELERQVDDLRAFEREYRIRLKAYLETQLRELEGRGAGAEPPTTPTTPAAPTMPTTPTAAATSAATSPAAGASPFAPAPVTRPAEPPPAPTTPSAPPRQADVPSTIEVDEGPEVPPSGT